MLLAILRSEPRAFTLIELLIVISIILILITIALPNFLEAQVRARVAATRGNLKSFETAIYSFTLDNKDPYPDFNDYPVDELTGLVARLRARVPGKDGCKSVHRVCECTAPPIPVIDDIEFVASQADFYAPGIHCPLTSPVKYMEATKANDPFGYGILSHGYDSFPEHREGYPTGHISYGGVFGMGPDRVAGDWLRETEYTVDADGDGLSEGLPYNPTNGTSSRGDFWRVIAMDLQTARLHYSNRLWN